MVYWPWLVCLRLNEYSAITPVVNKIATSKAFCFVMRPKRLKRQRGNVT